MPTVFSSQVVACFIRQSDPVEGNFLMECWLTTTVACGSMLTVTRHLDEPSPYMTIAWFQNLFAMFVSLFLLHSPVQDPEIAGEVFDTKYINCHWQGAGFTTSCHCGDIGARHYQGMVTALAGIYYHIHKKWATVPGNVEKKNLSNWLIVIIVLSISREDQLGFKFSKMLKSEGVHWHSMLWFPPLTVSDGKRWQPAGGTAQ